ncbi:MFS transporter [Gordonia iterans]
MADAAPGHDSDTHGKSVPFSVVGGAATGTVLQPLNATMISIGTVAISVHFASGESTSWVISAMYIATAVCAPMAGRFGAVFGARRVFVAGLALTGLGATIGMLAPSIGWLIAAYAVIGTGISVHTPNAMTIIRGDGERHQRSTRHAITALVITGQSTAALGPTLGGLLVGAFGWQAILWVNFPMVLLSAAAIMAVDVGDVGNRTGTAGGVAKTLRAFDLLGAVLFVATLTPTMFFLISLRGAPAWWVDLAALVALAVFVAVELHVDDPFLHVRELRANAPLRWTLIRVVGVYVTFYLTFFGIPQWLQQVRGMTPTQAGLIMLPLASIGVVATLGGTVIFRRFGARITLLAAGLALLGAGIGVTFFEKTSAPVWVLVVVAGALGVPNGLYNIANQNLVNAASSAEAVGMAIGMYRTMMFVGANLAVAILALITGGRFDDAGMTRIGSVIIGVTVVLLLGALVAPHLRGEAGRAEQDVPLAR